LPRCIKLNNYWCVKRAGWAGELAADAEDHVAFASALDGATVAAALLRHYYLDLNRRSARAIIARWAPASCGLIATRTSGTRTAARPTKIATGATLGGIAPRGIGRTLRARWIAAHKRGFAARGSALPRSVIPSRPMRMMPAPTIAVGMGEITVAPIKLASRTLPDSFGGRSRPHTAFPAPSCSSDNARINAYAQNAVKGLGKTPDEDLELFANDGTPGPNLPRLMANMAAVEIGPHNVSSGLVAAGIAAALRARATR
jgi:hypothetical protein